MKLGVISIDECWWREGCESLFDFELTIDASLVVHIDLGPRSLPPLESEDTCTNRKAMRELKSRMSLCICRWCQWHFRLLG